MSGLGKGVSGVVGISRNGSGAGTFPDMHVAAELAEPRLMIISTLPMPAAREYQGYLNQEHSLLLPISLLTSLGTQQQHWTGMPFSTPQLDTMQIGDDAYQAVDSDWFANQADLLAQLLQFNNNLFIP